MALEDGGGGWGNAHEWVWWVWWNGLADSKLYEIGHVPVGAADDRTLGGEVACALQECRGASAHLLVPVSEDVVLVRSHHAVDRLCDDLSQRAGTWMLDVFGGTWKARPYLALGTVVVQTCSDREREDRRGAAYKGIDEQLPGVLVDIGGSTQDVSERAGQAQITCQTAKAVFYR
jgi:hypothetical protein